MKKNIAYLCGLFIMMNLYSANAVISKYELSNEILHGDYKTQSIRSEIKDSSVIFDKQETSSLDGYNFVKDSYFYIFIGGGAIITNDTALKYSSNEYNYEHNNIGWNVNGGLGVNIFSFMRLDAEVASHMITLKADKNTLSLVEPNMIQINPLTAMGNIYLDLFGRYSKTEDIILKHGFTPYVGAGIGISYLDFPDIKINSISLNNDSSYQMSWQLMAGFSFSLSDTMDLNLGYKYINFGKYENDNINGKFTANEINITLKANF